MERKRGKCWKLSIFKVNFRFLLVIWVKWKQSVCSITLLYSSTFYSLFLPFFVLEIFKFKYDTFFVRNSAAISKFKWFEQLCAVDANHLVKTVVPIMLNSIDFFKALFSERLFLIKRLRSNCHQLCNIHRSLNCTSSPQSTIGVLRKKRSRRTPCQNAWVFFWKFAAYFHNNYS